MDTSDPRYPVVERLLAHWTNSPNAADTLDGICEWWLTGAHVHPERVSQALAWLAEQGVVATHEVADGRVLFRLAGTSTRSLT